jgi:hypothetical protein
MKSSVIALVVMFGLASLVWAQPPQFSPLQVEVMNQPLDVNVAQESQSYEYVVLYYENFDPGLAAGKFQEGLNTYASEGWEFVSWWYFVPVADSGGTGKHQYVAIMRRPQ